RQDGLQRLLEPGMEDGIGRIPHPLGLNHARRRPEQRQELGGPISDILMRLPGWLSLRFPVLTGIGDGLIGACLILAASPAGPLALLDPRKQSPLLLPPGRPVRSAPV